MERWSSLLSFVSATGWPVLLALVLSTPLAYWLSVKLQAFIYRHTGRAVLSFLYGLPAFVFLFWLASLFSWVVGTAVMGEIYGQKVVEIFIFFGSLFVLLFTGLSLLVGSILLARRAKALKNNPLQKVSGIKYFFYVLPALILALLASSFLLLSFA